MVEFVNYLDIKSGLNLKDRHQISQSGDLWQVSYHYLTSNGELSASIGYDVIGLSSIEYATFQTMTAL